MLNDVRYALRALADSPGFAAAAVLTLALGIGANTAIFTAVYGVLLKPLPYGDPDRLVRISETRRGGAWNVAYPNYLDWRARNHVFEAMAIFNTAGRATFIDGSAPPQTFPGGSCETAMFAVMGIRPAYGRLFDESDAAKNAASVAVITDRAWRARFGGDLSVAGRTVRIGEDDVTIVGILPPDVRPFDVDVWWPQRPAQLPAIALDRANHPGFGVVARLRTGAGAEDAQREMSAIAASLAREYPASNTDFGVRVRPMIDAVAGGVRPTLRLLMAAVAVLLLIACANVANLLLARGLRREREISVRAALGASRGRIVRLFLVEGTVLGMIGAASGLIVAGWGVRLLHDVPGFSLPRASEVTIDPHVLGFAVTLGFATALLFALAPSMQLSRVDLMRVLRQSGGTASPRQMRVRSLLVAGEVALLVVLLSGAALMLRSLGKLASVDVGFDAPQLIAAPLQQLQSRYADETALLSFAESLTAAMKARPGVGGAALAWPFDVTGFTWAPNVNIPDHPFPPGKEPPAQTAAVTPGYFAVMGIPIRRGRDFGPLERRGGPVSVIVNDTFASRFFPGEDPLGRRVAAMRIPELAEMTIVGVVGDTRRGGALAGFTPEIYVPFAQFPQSGATLVVRSGPGVEPASLADDARSAVAAIDRSTTVGTIQRVSDALARSYGDRRALAWLLGTFAVLALALTTLGIASVVAFTVAQRVREIGVRVAVGASPGEVVRLVVRGALLPIVLGAAAGVAALLPLSGLLRSYLYDVSPLDPASLAASVSILIASAALAAYLPARRASRIDPMIALRAQ